MNNQHQPKVMNVNTPPQINIPKLPPMAMSTGEIVALTNNTWICHGCDKEVAYGKRRCRCGCWRDGVRGPTKKKPKTEVKKAPNYKKAATSNAGQKQINEFPRTPDDKDIMTQTMAWLDPMYKVNVK